MNEETKLIKAFNRLMRLPLKVTKTFRGVRRVGRNEPCPCKSGKKFKKCCMLRFKPPLTQLARKELEKERRWLLKAAHRKYKEITSEN